MKAQKFCGSSSRHSYEIVGGVRICSRCGRRHHWDYTPEERFWRLVEKTRACWIWKGARIYSGYAYFGHSQGRLLRAHRYAWLLEYGWLPNWDKDRMVLDHVCGNRACVRPSHLRVVSQLENIRSGKGAGQCRKGHVFKPGTVKEYTDKSGKITRRCLVCKGKVKPNVASV